MDRPPRLLELQNGVRVLSLEDIASGLMRHGLSPVRLEELSRLGEAELEDAGNSLDHAARSIAVAFLAGEEPFWEADAILNALMDRVRWRAPEAFWRIFIAFEDSETAAEPQVAAVEKVRAALEHTA